MTRKRRVWKTFYVESGRDWNNLDSAWQSCSEAWHRKYEMSFEDGIQMLETNLPFRDLRDFFRLAGVPWIDDYVSDTTPSWEQEVNDERG